MPITIPVNKLAEFITAKTPAHRIRIVRQLKRSTKSHPIYYTLFHGVAKRFLVNGAIDATGILRLIEKLKTRNETPWKSIDSRITAEALRALIKVGPQLHKRHLVFSPVGANAKAKVEFAGVHISATPNLLVRGERNGKPLIGALRFYIAKESTYELGRRGAEIVAVLEYLWLSHLATGARTPDPELCIVLECFQERITAAPARIEDHLASIERGCRELAQLWRVVDDQEAA